MKNKIIFHIDVNSAYLSWEAVDRLAKGETLDLRTIPSAVGGNPEKRHGIILAKSIPAKKYAIQTGESLAEALKKCPILKIVPPRYTLYVKASQAMVDIIKRYSEKIERYSIDECFVDFTDSVALFGDPLAVANRIRKEILSELGFSVSIGISTNKLLAKMASELKKPDAVSTLFPDEIERKMWPLPIGELFMVGRANYKKMLDMGILTIGDLAHLEPDFLRSKFKSMGLLLWQYANGIDYSQVHSGANPIEKSIGNSTTTGFDVTTIEEAEKVLLSLCESVGERLREKGYRAHVIGIRIKNSEFISSSKQRKVSKSIEGTLELYKLCKILLRELWKGEPLRHLGVFVSDLDNEIFVQLDCLTSHQTQKLSKLDFTLDEIRKKYHKDILVRGCFLNSGIKPYSGGVGEEEFFMMGSVL